MHSYHGEWVSVAEPREDAFQTLTAASRSTKPNELGPKTAPTHRSGSQSPSIYSIPII